jgi:hypothetical protein
VTNPSDERAPFTAECPTCGTDRLQTGYSLEELRALLSDGAEIEAYCISCDDSWSISTEERADLAAGIERSGQAERPTARRG